MSRTRILLDDEGQCRTQRAVLATFIAQTPNVEVIWSSHLPKPKLWKDAPLTSALRLRTYLAALTPMPPDCCTLFLPGHIVPGAELQLLAGPFMDMDDCACLVNLDVFFVNNCSSSVLNFSRQAHLNPDYQSLSSHSVAGIATIPTWVFASGLKSAQQLNSRPWYFARAPAREQWLTWVSKALQQGQLTIKDAEDDVRQGLARPSLLQEITAIANDDVSRAMPDITIDSLYVPPEVRVPKSQIALLHSMELQERALHFRKLNTKAKKASLSYSPQEIKRSLMFKLLVKLREVCFGRLASFLSTLRIIKPRLK